jgi:hypothetical protein
MWVTSATSHTPVALGLIVLNIWMLWRQLQKRNYRRAGGLAVVIAMLAGWMLLPPTLSEHLNTYLHQLGLGTHGPKTWKEQVTYDRVVATLGVLVPIIQLLLDQRKKKPRVEGESHAHQNRRDMLKAVRTRVDELVEKTVKEGSEIGLGFVEVPDALIRLEELSRVPRDAPGIISIGTPILSVFEQFGRHPLILGAPGGRQRPHFCANLRALWSSEPKRTSTSVYRSSSNSLHGRRNDSL